MLTSLLSLYIASVLETSVPFFAFQENEPPSVIKTAGLDLSDVENDSSIPLKKPEFISPIIKAKSSLAMDLKTGLVLFENNAHDRLPIASLTKLMTALIIMEENGFDEVVTVSQKAASVTGSVMFLKKGEEIKVKDLIAGMIISSSNDAAEALAEHNAKTPEDFVVKMNKKALALGLLNTHFSNPIGLDDKDNYSSAYDLAKLSQYVYQKSFIKELASVPKLNVTSIDGKTIHKLESTNELLDTKFIKIKGLKTGTTDSAGLCIVTVAENADGNEILTVLLNSPNRFKEAKILADWVFRAYNWQR